MVELENKNVEEVQEIKVDLAKTALAETYQWFRQYKPEDNIDFSWVVFLSKEGLGMAVDKVDIELALSKYEQDVGKARVNENH